MPESHDCAKTFELGCSSLQQSCRHGCRLAHQAVEKEHAAWSAPWLAASCLPVSRPVFFPTCCDCIGCQSFQAGPLAVHVVVELLSQLEALGMLQRQDSKRMVGTRWLGAAPADAARLGCCCRGDGIASRQRSGPRDVCWS